MYLPLRKSWRHEFWPDSVRLLDRRHVEGVRLLDSAQVTDSYLLALAASRGGELATFDRQLVRDAVVNGAQSSIDCVLLIAYF
jgi:predicted nucleic acid-binding protein